MPQTTLLPACETVKTKRNRRRACAPALECPQSSSVRGTLLVLADLIDRMHESGGGGDERVGIDAFADDGVAMDPELGSHVRETGAPCALLLVLDARDPELGLVRNELLDGEVDRVHGPDASLLRGLVLAVDVECDRRLRRNAHARDRQHR